MSGYFVGRLIPIGKSVYCLVDKEFKMVEFVEVTGGHMTADAHFNKVRPGWKDDGLTVWMLTGGQRSFFKRQVPFVEGVTT